MRFKQPGNKRSLYKKKNTNYLSTYLISAYISCSRYMLFILAIIFPLMRVTNVSRTLQTPMHIYMNLLQNVSALQNEKQHIILSKKNLNVDIYTQYTKNKTISERFLAFCRSVIHRDTVQATATTTDREVKTKGGPTPVHTLSFRR